MNCNKELTPKMIAIDKNGEWKLTKRKLEKGYYQCNKCKRIENKTSKISDSVIDYELRKAGII